ncbi:MAG: ribonuclease III [Coriobacteriales bacterium]|jgi:ribonuclease-3|nr:ribonuclease III [Coriobacteriales bacterium]
MAVTDTERIECAERILGYTFNDKALLLRALTHPSAIEENAIEGSYERLEFLGDSFLGAFVSLTLYERFPDLDEGALTRIKVSLVSGGMLSERCAELGFADLIIFGSSERGTGRRGLYSALENVFEALIAAIALDGGASEAQRWVLEVLDSHISRKLAAEPENPKSILQEILQASRITPTYEVVETSGPPHERIFTCNVLSAGVVVGTGTGHSKKDAEAAAAAHALKRLSRRDRRKAKKVVGEDAPPVGDGAPPAPDVVPGDGCGAPPADEEAPCISDR